MCSVCDKEFGDNPWITHSGDLREGVINIDSHCGAGLQMVSETSVGLFTVYMDKWFRRQT